MDKIRVWESMNPALSLCTWKSEVWYEDPEFKSHHLEMSSISSSPFPRLHGSHSHSCLCHAIIIYRQLWSLEVNVFWLFMEAWLLL